MRILLSIILAAFAPLVHAQPYLYCDLAPAATHYTLQYCSSLDATGLICNTWPAAWEADTPFVVGGVTGRQCKTSLAPLPMAKHIVRAKAVLVDATWGRQESAPSTPLPFERPSLPGAPSSLRIGL